MASPAAHVVAFVPQHRDSGNFSTTTVISSATLPGQCKPTHRNLAEDVCFNNSVFRFIQTMEGIIRVSRREERLFMMSVNTLFLVPLRHVTHATDNKELN